MTDPDKYITRHELELMGLNPDNHDDLREFRKDMEWTRVQRQRCSTLTGKLITYVILTLAGGGLVMMWHGFKAKVGQ